MPKHALPRARKAAAGRRIGTMAMALMGSSVSLMVALGVASPSYGKTPAAWPASLRPFAQLSLPPPASSLMLWLTQLLGGISVILGLLALRRGWRPPVRLMIGASAVAVIMLMLIPPVDNADPTMYAAFGRMVTLGHSPYVMTIGQLKRSGDPAWQSIARSYLGFPTRYGPVATASEAMASVLAGDSMARTIFWMKVWNALAYLALVLSLDRAMRQDPALRLRAHLLWSVNPLMLFAVMASGHNDVLAAAAGTCALIALRPGHTRRALLAGALAGLAVAIKSPYALLMVALLWAARRSPRTASGLVLASAAVVVPSYLLAGKAAVADTFETFPPNGLWADIASVVRLTGSFAAVNAVGLVASGLLAIILLYRLPPGAPDAPDARVALALCLGLVILAPQQSLGYDAMIFPLLAMMPATRLDLAVVVNAVALAGTTAPYLSQLDPGWLTAIERITTLGSPTLILVASIGWLFWLCVTRKWGYGASPGAGPAPVVLAGPGQYLAD